MALTVFVRASRASRCWRSSRAIHSFARPTWALRQRQLTTESAAQTAERNADPPAYFYSNGVHEDSAIRLVFDSPVFWKQFVGKPGLSGSASQRGLFQNRYLTTPDGFDQFTHESLAQCDRIVQRILSASTTAEMVGLVRDMDRLSDLLCRVIDQADFVRSTHPDRRFQAAATKAHILMFDYMNQLNTTTGLNEQLKKAWALPIVQATWSDEEKAAAEILMRDFAHSAIHLPESARTRFVQLSSEISQTGAEFVDQMAPQHEFLTFSSRQLNGLDPEWVKKVSSWGKVTIPAAGESSMRALRMAADPDVRQLVYTTRRQSSTRNVRRLERLLAGRAELADLSGFASFGHLALSDKMAASPEAVSQFLNALLAANRPKVDSELASLRALKAADGLADGRAGQLDAWDVEYYHHRLTAELRRQLSTPDGPDALASYFSVGTVMQGISRLFTRLYGIRMIPASPGGGETWHGEVRRLDVLDESGEPVGVVYCDLFARAGKVANPAHFTLRCSRQIIPGELAELADKVDPVEAATDGMAHRFDKTTGQLYQLPTIALVCDFVRPHQSRFQASSAGLSPALLSFRDVKTLFHEMGHAVHSLLGRTQLQNVAGTRCAVDFAELPSVMMEHFVAVPEVLTLWARHWKTDAPLPLDLIHRRLSLDRIATASETEAHILLALLDQAYHSTETTQQLLKHGHFDSTAAYHRVYSQYSSMAEPKGTSYQGFFGHLVGYGATYYAYLFDRAIASRVWSHLFQHKDGVDRAISRQAGEKFKTEVLQWGGSRSGWRCVAGVLDRPELADGGERGMKEVGLWGIDEV